jgi:GNAT superfamily N-acetyltransferase
MTGTMNGEKGVTDVSEYPVPPFGFETNEGKTVEVREYDGERDALRRMYEEFDPADRAQGIPPVRDGALEAWLGTVLHGEDDGGSVNAVAWCEGEAVGHATLVTDKDIDAYELAIFVLQSHQGEGVGSRLICGTLALAYERGVRDVWLTVERWNHAAVRLYRKVGFEKTSQESFEIEMATRLVSR